MDISLLRSQADAGDDAALPVLVDAWLIEGKTTLEVRRLIANVHLVRAGLRHFQDGQALIEMGRAIEPAIEQAMVRHADFVQSRPVMPEHFDVRIPLAFAKLLDWVMDKSGDPTLYEAGLAFRPATSAPTERTLFVSVRAYRERNAALWKKGHRPPFPNPVHPHREDWADAWPSMNIRLKPHLEASTITWQYENPVPRGWRAGTEFFGWRTKVAAWPLPALPPFPKWR